VKGDMNGILKEQIQKHGQVVDTNDKKS
jgi:hypothetical protein